MTMRRPLRRWVSGWFVLMIVLAQIVTAAYACPQVPAAIEAGSMAGMPCASDEPAPISLDAEQPALCVQHCQFGSTQAFSDASLSQPPAGPTHAALVFPAPSVAMAADGPASAERDGGRNRAPPPTHALLHCCLRL
jgi:hypothetical protein